jgi:tetratricopeptide (TPR) repeat protein
MLSSSDRVATHVNRGILHALKKDYSKAFADYDQAIALNPREPEALLNKGILLLRGEVRHAEALALVNSAILHKTTMPALAYFARGIAHEQLGQTAAAYRDYRQAAALSPKWDAPTRELRRFRTKADP